MGRNDEVTTRTDADPEQEDGLIRMTRAESDVYVERMKAALREAGEGHLADRVATYHKGEYRGVDDGYGPAIGWYRWEPTSSQQDALMKAALVARVPGVVCDACWKAEKGCTEPFHADDCEEWGEGR